MVELAAAADDEVGVVETVEPPVVELGDDETVTAPAGDPAVLLGLESFMHPALVPFTTNGPADPPVPGPLLSPANSVTLVPLRTFTFQLNGCWFGERRKDSPPGIMPYIDTGPEAALAPLVPHVSVVVWHCERYPVGAMKKKKSGSGVLVRHESSSEAETCKLDDASNFLR